MSRDADELLLRSLRKLGRDRNNTQAWGHVLRAVQGLVAQACQSVGLRGSADIEDVMQATALRIARARHLPLDDVAAFRAYTWRTAQRGAIDTRRSAMRLQQSPGRISGPPPADDTTAGKRLAQITNSKLTEPERQLLERMLSSPSLGEIAESLELTYAAAAMRVTRLRAKLLEILHNYENE